ncbi:hypothetical protein AQ750_04695 [Burkholderia pseudomallei]|nr:hypothetical protein AQ736_03415 [Burkholderia pseudomallei]OMS96438.1 hypothetical protein AQ750_04695 [Burkholderia pseudomallei]OMV27155.1 hypothetical protein AQ787_14125 [Burkholderia pseudomallei]
MAGVRCRATECGLGAFSFAKGFDNLACLCQVDAAFDESCVCFCPGFLAGRTSRIPVADVLQTVL